MTDDIRRLLGGYATNSLTETERQTLFDAALDDQELFDALQLEQALRDLLDDPVSRVQIRVALDQPSPVAWWSRWWSHWWTWTAAASAVAAAVLIVAVARTHAPQPIQHYAYVQAPQPVAAPPPAKLESSDADVRRLAPARVTQSASREESKQVVRVQPTVSQNQRKDEMQPPPAPAAPPPPPIVLTTPQQQAQLDAQSPARSGQTQAQSQQVVVGAVNSLRDQQQSPPAARQFSAAVNGALLKSALEPVSFSLLKRDASGADQALTPAAALKPGDAVRLRVVPLTSGYLSLSRQDAAGQWTLVYPETGPGLQVTANAHYTIPDSSIEVTESDQRFRLSLIPTSIVSVGSGAQRKAKSAPLKKEANPNAPFFVDFTIGSSNVP